MPFDEFYIDEVQDYLEERCIKNKLVAHTKVTERNPEGQRSFARFESNEQMNQITSSQAKNIVVVADYYGQRIGDADDKRMRAVIQLRFAVKKDAASGDEQNAVNDAIKLAEKIMFQFMVRMEKDMQDGCNALEALEPEKMVWDKIEEQPWLDDYYGWDLSVPFRSYIPEYNADDWEEDV